MPRFSSIVIIFNPNSTGPSKDDAEKLAAELQQNGVEPVAQLIATERARHAVELAREIAGCESRPLIVSSSGDGGYHEVINGALSAGAHPVCAVLPAGNANDHSRTIQKRPLAEAIADGSTSRLDVLRVSIVGRGGERTVLAHSYAGIGLTPTIAVMLNREHLNRVKESILAYKGLRNLQPVVIEQDGRQLQIDSLILANIPNMAKVLKVANNAEPDDGLMNVTTFPHRKKIRLVTVLLKAMITGIRGVPTARYEFTAAEPLAIQIDGEVYDLEADDKVSVTVAVGALETLR